MAYTVFVDGAAGTTGLRIRKRLALRGDVKHLVLEEELRKDLDARLDAVARADVSILCLPDEAARQVAASAPADARLVDASTAHRTSPGWVYGFPELAGRRQAVQTAARVAVPGCHASGFLALAAPLVEAGALAREATLVCQSLTGFSGGGKAMVEAYTDDDRPEDYDAPRLYGLGLTHKHLPEMQAVAGLAKPPLFTPVVADFFSGMLVSLPLEAEALTPALRSGAALAAFYRETYAGEPLITVHGAGEAPPDGMLSALGMARRDSMELFILGNDDQILLCARYDNLGKGAAGAAMQCMNLMLGLPETEGLIM